MNPQQLKEHLTEEIAATPCSLTTLQKTLKDHQALLDTIIEFQAEQGWLVFQSEAIFATSKEKLQEILKTQSGYLLNGELSKAPNESLHFVENGQSGWLVTQYQENEPQGNEEDLMVDRVEMLGKKRKDRTEHPKISYQRYWKHTEKIGYHPYATRFTGFKHEENLL